MMLKGRARQGMLILRITEGEPTDDVEGQGEVGDVQLAQEVVERAAEEHAENKKFIK